jgi:hypothetical protein
LHKHQKEFQLPPLNHEIPLPFPSIVIGEILQCGMPINSESPSFAPSGSCSGSSVAVSAQLVYFALGILERLIQHILYYL